MPDCIFIVESRRTVTERKVNFVFTFRRLSQYCFPGKLKLDANRSELTDEFNYSYLDKIAPNVFDPKWDGHQLRAVCESFRLQCNRFMHEVQLHATSEIA